jgi:predicted nuclease of predicted toxin-antitoxin system
MIKLLADENFPIASVEILKSKKYDVLSILRSHSGISDTEVIHLANHEERLILTFDRDFGKLIYKEGIIPSYGVFYFRLIDFHPEQPAQIALALLEKPNFDIQGIMTVIEENFIRQKKF